MKRRAFWMLMLAGLAACGGSDDPAGPAEEVDTTLWVTPCCYLTWAHAQTAKEQTMAPGGTMELNVAYLTTSGAVIDRTAAAEWVFDPPERMSLSSGGTVACTADPSKRCKVVTNHGAVGEVTTITVRFEQREGDMRVTTVAAGS